MAVADIQELVGAVPPCRHICPNKSISSAQQGRWALLFLIKGKLFKKSGVISTATHFSDQEMQNPKGIQNEPVLE
ncbi:hypothetical protein Desti_0007 [Desulfomonile tiedjei DSM 6799]|uniref:Uncharacterized protein n=1 Tax=Desulfomonile tiedjei (strain ATCC 49306 / DSM 6799 / DCB-1) TaxID=706587 RepID=I4BZL8_DESTA|nr:hypothetical protein Desti_0007 [Desulfomonile tiedjei DSM 6799]